MTISTLSRRMDYTGSGITGPYAYTFRILAATDLVVTTRNLVGTEATLVNVTDYAVTMASDGTGSISLTTALPIGYALTIRRVRPLLQSTDVRNQGVYFAEVHEDVFDNQTMVSQQQQDQIDRSLKLPTTIDPTTVTTDLPVPVGSAVLGWNSLGTRIVNYVLEAASSIAVPIGRLVSTVTQYLLNNAVYNAADYGLSVSGSRAANATAILAAMTAANANGGGTVVIPANLYNVDGSALTFQGMSNVIIEGRSPGWSYGFTKNVSVLNITTGVYGIRFGDTSSCCGLRNLALLSNGVLGGTAPHAPTANGVEYGVVVETGSTVMENVTVFGFQHGCVGANGLNSNVFNNCAFIWNTRTGFGVTFSSAAAYAAYHPNLSVPTAYTPSTVWTMRDCKFRRNGWGMIVRDGSLNLEGTCINEANYFGGVLEYTGSLDSSCAITGKMYLEANWLFYDTTANYSMASMANNLLRETASTYMAWTTAVATAINDAGYQIYSMAAAGGTATGPTGTLRDVNMVNSSSGVTPGKSIYIKQGFLWRFENVGCTGGDQPNAVRLGDGTGGFYANAPHFLNYQGTLPAALGNRGAQFDVERSNTYGGGLTATIGFFKGLFGNLQFPATQVPSADPNCLDDYKEGTWTPTPTGFTVVGTPTYAGTYTKIGRRVFFTVAVSSTTSVATVAGTSLLTLPTGLDPARSSTCAASKDDTSATAGSGWISAAGKTVYPPTLSAVVSLSISGSYDV